MGRGNAVARRLINEPSSYGPRYDAGYSYGFLPRSASTIKGHKKHLFTKIIEVDFYELRMN